MEKNRTNPNRVKIFQKDILLAKWRYLLKIEISLKLNKYVLDFGCGDSKLKKCFDWEKFEWYNRIFSISMHYKILFNKR